MRVRAERFFLTSRAVLPGLVRRARNPQHIHRTVRSLFVLVVIPLLVPLMAFRVLPHLRQPLFLHSHRSFRSTALRDDFHFDTHHFVQRLEREGLNRAQAEGIMSAMAEVIDESIRNMTSNMVTKADHEKVRVFSRAHHHLLSAQITNRGFYYLFAHARLRSHTATLHAAGRLCAAQIGAPAEREE